MQFVFRCMALVLALYSFVQSQMAQLEQDRRFGQTCHHLAFPCNERLHSLRVTQEKSHCNCCLRQSLGCVEVSLCCALHVRSCHQQQDYWLQGSETARVRVSMDRDGETEQNECLQQYMTIIANACLPGIFNLGARIFRTRAMLKVLEEMRFS